jgi:hypothetical protein
MKLWMWGVLVGLVVAGIIGVAAASAITRAKARAANVRAAKAACGSSPAARQPVFVMMVVPGPEAEPAAMQSLVAAFENAACPLRVVVGVAEYTAPDSVLQPLAARFAAAAKASAMPFQLAHHLRVLQAPVTEFPGAAAAREQVQRFLYHGEPYVATIEPGVLLAKGWDKTLQAALAGLPPRSVLTAMPARAGTPAAASPLGTFTGVTAGLPVVAFAGYAMKVPTGVGAVANLPAVVPAVAWSPQVSFSAGPLPLVGSTQDSSPTDASEAVQVTCRLVDLQWGLFHPTARVAVARPVDGPALTAATAATPARDWRVSPAAAWALGLAGDGGVEARARLGLVPGPNPPAEVAVKVGSTGDVLSVLARLDADTKRKGAVKGPPPPPPRDPLPGPAPVVAPPPVPPLRNTHQHVYVEPAGAAPPAQAAPGAPVPAPRAPVPAPRVPVPARGKSPLRRWDTLLPMVRPGASTRPAFRDR